MQNRDRVFRYPAFYLRFYSVFAANSIVRKLNWFSLRLATASLCSENNEFEAIELEREIQHKKQNGIIFLLIKWQKCIMRSVYLKCK